MSTKQLSIIVGAILIGAAMIAFGPYYLEYRAQNAIDTRSDCVRYRSEYAARRGARHADPDILPTVMRTLRELEADRRVKGCTHAERYEGFMDKD
jgi:hypothetical protein